MKPEHPTPQTQLMPQPSHARSIRLSLRKIRSDEELFKEGEDRSEAILGSFSSKDGKKKAATIVLICASPGEYRRLASRTLVRRQVKVQDLKVSDLHQKVLTPMVWSMREVFIDPPRLSLPPSSINAVINHYPTLRVSLNYTRTLQAGLEVTGFWGCGDRGVIFQSENISGEKIYRAAVVYKFDFSLSAPFIAMAFAIRNVNSREGYGLTLQIRFDRWFRVSIAYDIDDEELEQGTFFDRTVYIDPPASSHPSMGDSLVTFQTRDGSHIFCSLKMQKNKEVQTNGNEKHKINVNEVEIKLGYLRQAIMY